MNIALNLLPWRAERRQRRWRYSLLALLVSALAGGTLWWWLNTAADARLAAQRQHNQALAQQVAELDARIEAFERHLQQQRAQALAHARLERERLSFVHMLEALSRNTPAGVVLTDVQQQGDTLALTARTAASTQIARTIRQWEAAGATSLSTISADGQGGHTFTLSTPWPIADQADEVQIAHIGGRQ